MMVVIVVMLVAMLFFGQPEETFDEIETSPAFLVMLDPGASTGRDAHTGAHDYLLIYNKSHRDWRRLSKGLQTTST
jgi:hypothetical protein